MGRKEEPMLYYYGQDCHFAELLNGWLFGGKRKIAPVQVRPEDTRYTGKGKSRRKNNYRSRYRDIVKHVENMRFRLMIGTEVQTYVDYAMPVRAVDYDVLEYWKQIEDLRQKYKESHPEEIRLSALGKSERLLPVFTLVLYLGEEPWDAERNLRGLLDLSGMPEELRGLLPDYPLDVLDVCHTPDERLMEFPDDIACMFLLLKYRKDKKKLLEMMENVEGFRHMEEDAYETICDYTKDSGLSELKERVRKRGEGGTNMIEALQEIREDERKAGVEQGVEQGESRLRGLLSELLERGRLEDVERTIKDKEYGKKLMRELGL